jgi:hypothetical protein
LAGWAKIQYARDDERLHFYKNLNKNIDNEVCVILWKSNEFPNHPLLTMMQLAVYVHY